MKQYCFNLYICYQAMYDAVQKLDKKLDLLHRKVSEMQHTRVRPLVLKPVSIKELEIFFFPYNFLISSDAYLK